MLTAADPASSAAKRQAHGRWKRTSRCSGVPVSAATTLRFRGRLTRQTPASEPRGAPIGPRTATRAMAVPTVTTASASVTIEIVRS